ncbi:MAG TPA: hypothetical protein VIG24_18100 [Acidimicrobiia bacterium]
MAIRSGQISVGTVATEIPATSHMPFRLEIKNLDNTDDVYIGNGDVTTSNGLRLAKAENIQLFMAPLDTIKVVATKADHKVAYIIFEQVT